jgi:hypothetical protein
MAGWIVVRTILVMDAVLVIAVGFICLLWFARPAGVLIAGSCWMAAGGLFGLLPFTDPYRVMARRARKAARAQSSGWVVSDHKSV